MLLVEDNEVNRSFLVKMLQISGFDCDVATDGLEAVKACRQTEYDIVFMDCQMPNLDGYAATRQIREEEKEKRHTPIIALTAYAMKGDAEKCLEAGMDAYLSKPVEIEKILAMIERYCGVLPEGGD